MSTTAAATAAQRRKHERDLAEKSRRQNSNSNMTAAQTARAHAHNSAPKSNPLARKGKPPQPPGPSDDNMAVPSGGKSKKVESPPPVLPKRVGSKKGGGY